MDRIVIIDGVSKTYAMTGWRIGWSIAPEAREGDGRSRPEHDERDRDRAARRDGGDPGPQDEVIKDEDAFQRRDVMVAELSSIPGVKCRTPRARSTRSPTSSALRPPRTREGRPRTTRTSPSGCSTKRTSRRWAGRSAPGYIRFSCATNEERIRGGSRPSRPRSKRSRSSRGVRHHGRPHDRVCHTAARRVSSRDHCVEMCAAIGSFHRSQIAHRALYLRHFSCRVPTAAPVLPGLKIRKALDRSPLWFDPLRPVNRQSGRLYVSRPVKGPAGRLEIKESFKCRNTSTAPCSWGDPDPRLAAGLQLGQPTLLHGVQGRRADRCKYRRRRRREQGRRSGGGGHLRHRVGGHRRPDHGLPWHGDGPDAPQADRDAAEAKADKTERMKAYCSLAVTAIGTVKASAKATIKVTPPGCSASISAKAQCQGGCSGSAKCDVKANPPTCSKAAGRVQGVRDGAEHQCEGSCGGTCEGSCTASRRRDGQCEGKCEGTCAADAQGGGGGIQADGSCRARARHLHRERDGPKVECSGSCNGPAPVAARRRAAARRSSATASAPASSSPSSARAASSGRLQGRGEVEANCDASVRRPGRVPPGGIDFSFAGDADAAAKLKATLDANFPASSRRSRRASTRSSR